MGIEYLRAQGFRIVESDWRCRLGQIDIVAEEAEVLVAVEVRARCSASFGTPEESVDWRKQRKLQLLLQAYLAASRRQGCAARIDVLAMQLGPHLELEHCRHIRNAVEVY